MSANSKPLAAKTIEKTNFNNNNCNIVDTSDQKTNKTEIFNIKENDIVNDSTNMNSNTPKKDQISKKLINNQNYSTIQNSFCENSTPKKDNDEKEFILSNQYTFGKNKEVKILRNNELMGSNDNETDKGLHQHEMQNSKNLNRPVFYNQKYLGFGPNSSEGIPTANIITISMQQSLFSKISIYFKKISISKISRYFQWSKQ